ncbi:MAG TPA: hypothetical protein VMW28_01395 [Pelolinea sp.]|nr:hypothetical protein [Pelolinea sp.]
MRSILFFVILLLIFSSACGKLPAEYPADFSLTLDWNTGALPPKYHYRTTVTIGPGSQGEFSYHPGYEEESEYIWASSFDLTETQLQALYRYLKENNVMRERWKTGQPLIGGQGTSIIINAYGKEYHVPSVSEINQSDRQLIDTTIEVIRSYVPQEIWNEMDARQAEYDKNYED